MIYLFISIFMAVSIVNLLKHFQKKNDVSIYAILLFNYLFASIFSIFFNKFHIHKIGLFEIILAIIMGAFYFVNFLLYNKNIKSNGIALTVSITRISLIIPIFISIFLFKEVLEIYHYLGIVIILVAFLILGSINKKINFIWVLLLFLGTGFGESGMKIFQYYSNSEISSYLFYLFGFAFLFNLLMIIIKKIHISPYPVFAGLILSIPNQLTSFFFIKSLYSIPASIAYPVFGSLVVLISIITDIFLWKSKFSLKEKIIFSLLIVGIILININ